ncbi:TM2 domain-containing protein 2 isoform X2 [Corvus moneduloides]|uniref:TM2 domain-containing protein 2 isoform X2 n=1 Tax=Corvus moneduloides TaxID=1196302 RepID=UPI001361FF6E|nr:TM2 domain-containing protein 2 isoform X2 [Corvus moneduloides]
MAPPVGYALLCGQAVLLLGNLLLLHGRGLPGNDTEPRDLPPGPPAAAWAYSDPRAPLVLCTYLPDEFVECEEPVDHGGNATAQQELGHGCVKVHGTLLHHHSALLLLPGLLRSGSVLPGPHRHRRGEAADPGGPGHLVVCGSDSADHRWADAQRWQQLVHRVLREGQGWPQLQPVDASARSKQQPRLCLAQRGLTEL